MGFGLAMPPTKELMYMNAMINSINGETINIALLVSTVAGLSWFRVIMALQVTETFGPLVTAIFKMVIDIILFLAIYVIQLVAFSIIAAMAFFSVTTFGHLYDTFLYMFLASFGAYNLEDFDVYDDRP